MAKLTWDSTGQRRYETGVDRGVLYLPDAEGAYNTGHAWNGLTTVTEAPEGAEANPQYADNIKYLNLVSAEEYKATIEAFTYPDAFEACMGNYEASAGVILGQQARSGFAFSWRTVVGNDTQGLAHGYKLHIVYGALAAPSERAYATINDSPEAITFSWEVSTSPLPVDGGSPVASITIDSTRVDSTKLDALEAVLYGADATTPRLPHPDEVLELMGGTVDGGVANTAQVASSGATLSMTPTTADADK